jgi:hypothetical protein
MCSRVFWECVSHATLFFYHLTKLRFTPSGLCRYRPCQIPRFPRVFHLSHSYFRYHFFPNISA